MANFINNETINFREKLSSKKHSGIIEKIKDELLDMNINLKEMEEKVLEIKNIKKINEKALITSITLLTNKFNTLQAQYERLNNNSVYRDLYVYTDKFENSYVSGENTSYIDKDSEITILNFNNSENKLIIKDNLYNEIFIPKDSTVEINYIVDGEYEVIDEKDYMNIIKPGEVFYSTIKTDRTVSEVLLEIVITLPKEIINNTDINTIIMEPFPYNNIDIVAIEYQNLGEIKMLDALKNHPKSTNYVLNDYQYDIIKNSKKETFNFPKLKTNEIRIKIRQNHYEDILNNRYFYIGIKELEILNLNYENDISSFYSIVEFNTNSEKTIHSIKPIINNPNYCNEEDIKIDLSYLDSLNNPIPIKESFPLKITNNKFLIKCTLFKNLTTPSVGGFKIKYTV